MEMLTIQSKKVLGQVLEQWNEMIWRPVVESTRGKKLLLADSLQLHKKNEELLKCQDKNLEIKYVPEHCTPILQPLDVVVMKLFKRNFRNTLGYSSGR